MPMAVFDGPHFSRWSFAGRLRRGRVLLCGRYGDGLRLRRFKKGGNGLLRRSLRLGKKVSRC